MHTTKISGLAVDTTYTFHLVLRTTAGTYTSDKVEVQTHKMTDLSGITITTGILPQATREQLAVAVERIGAKTVDSVRIDTTHFVTTEGRGIQWEKAVEMNIPVVRPEWVDACEKSGRILGVTKFYLDAVRAPPSEDHRPGTASTQLPPNPNHQEHGVQSPPPAPAPPPKEKDLPAAPANHENGDESTKNKGSERSTDDEEDAAAAQKKEEGVGGGGDDKESDEDEDEGDKPEDKFKSATEDEQKSRAEDKEQNLTARPKWAATIEDADDDKPAPSPSASRSSFQEVQL